MSSKYFRDQIRSKKAKLKDDSLKKRISERKAIKEKFSDTGDSSYMDEDDAQRESIVRKFKCGDKILDDWWKDSTLIDRYGKNAPKSRSFSTTQFPGKKPALPKEESSFFDKVRGLFKEGGGMIRDRRDGMAMGGRTRLPRVDDTKILMEAGGYSGGLAETGRGTMAGELGKKGSMSVREAGEDMYELSKRKRRMQGGGAASSYNRRNNNQNK